jgi:hypothetical protein
MQDTSLITHTHFCALFTDTVFIFSAYIITCTEFNIQIQRYYILHAILCQRPKRKFWPHLQTQSMLAVCFYRAVTATSIFRVLVT